MKIPILHTTWLSLMITDNPWGLIANVDQLKKLRGLADPLHVMLIDLETNFYQ